MNGLDLALSFYNETKEIVEDILGDDFTKATIGLVGHGSECYGFDDDFSKDHDYGAEYCIFLEDEIYRLRADEFKQKYEEKFKPYKEVLKGTESTTKRRGILSSKDFYLQNANIVSSNISNSQWLELKENRLCAVSNGAIFKEGNGSFMEIRHTLEQYYPESVWKKKLSSELLAMSQYGLYNVRRCILRNDIIAFHFAMNQFLSHALNVIYLINRKFHPFFKWKAKGILTLPLLSNLYEPIKFLSCANGEIVSMQSDNGVKNYPIYVFIEMICDQIAMQLERMKLVRYSKQHLEDCAKEILASIIESEIRDYPILIDD